jgi:7-carboxy-7-deazaguanine synthase
MGSLLVNEVFYSIQGEGSRAGLPCVFVRLQGCGLRCAWCDTTHALDRKSGGTRRDTEDVLAEIAGHKCSFVMLTGGEPLEQDECLPFVSRLCDEGYTVAIETGGHADVARVDPRAILIMDVKCPGSGMGGKNRLSNLEYLKPTDEIKFVILDESDYDWARAFVSENKLTSICREIIFSPVSGACELARLAERILADRLPVRLQTQLHKVIWGKDVAGK